MQPHLRLPDDFVARLLGFPGARAWLDHLPELLDELSTHWRLKLSPPFSPLSYNFVCPAIREDGTEVVFKVGLLRDELAIEIAALEAFGGTGAVELLDAAPEDGAMLLEKLHPGTMLVEVDDDQAATAVAADVMERLWVTAPENPIFPTAADWARGLNWLRKRFSGGTGPFPEKIVDTAEKIFSELLASEGERVLLHGDLHHFNILRAQRQPWLALDPKGLVGEREYEIGAFLRNPDIDALDPAEVKWLTLRRIDQFSERLGFDRERLVRWAYAQDVLSAWWSLEDGDPDWTPNPILAQVLQDRV